MKKILVHIVESKGIDPKPHEGLVNRKIEEETAKNGELISASTSIGSTTGFPMDTVRCTTLAFVYSE